MSRNKKFGRLYKMMLVASIFLMVSMTSLSPIVNVSKAKAASPSQVLIDEIFGGGGSEEDAPYNYDFVELYNPTDSSINLDGWSLQYTNKDMDYKWEKTDLTGSIPAQGYYLIGEHSDDSTVGLAELPTPDASGDIDIDNHFGEVVLTENQTLLQDNTDPNTDPDHGAISDFVGYGESKDVAYYKGNAPAPEATKKKSIERKAINSKDPNGPGLDAKPGQLGEFLGNGYNSGENSQDFTTVDSGSQALAQNSKNPVEPLIQGHVDLDNSDIKMGSDTGVSSNNNTFKIHLTSGQVKDGLISTHDYSISGLPTGLTSSAVGNAGDNSITFTIKGTADQAVIANVDLTVTLKSSVSTGIYGDSDAYGQRPIDGITLYFFTDKITATPVDTSVEIGENHTTISNDNASFSLMLHVGQIKNDLLDESDYVVTGLPEGLSVAAAEGDSSTNIVTFTLSGSAEQSVEDDIALSVVLKASSVTSGATDDSDPITGVTLKRYSEPVVEGAMRTQFLIDELKDENALDHNINFKHTKFNIMADSPAGFFEGSAGLFYKDIGSVIKIPDDWLSHPDWNTWIEGDLHLTNLGFISDNNDQGLFALNDPDEAFVAPFYYDLMRFVTSLYLTRDTSNISNLSDDELQKVAKAFMDQYYHTLQDDFADNKNIVTAYTSENLTGFVKEAMDQMTAANNQKSMLEDYTYIDGKGNRKFDISKTKLQQATFSDQKGILSHFQSYLDSIDAASYKKINPNYFKIKDMSERVYVGTGSLGDKRYWLLLEGPTSSPDDDIILDVKQEKASAVLKSSAVSVSGYPEYDPDDEAKRVLSDFRATVPDASRLTGELKNGKETYFVSPRSPYHGDYTDSALGDFRNEADVVNYVTTSAKVEANAQAVASETGTTGQPNFVNSFVTDFPSEEVWDDFARQLIHLSEDYYYQVNADYKAMKSDLINDNLLSASEQGEKANVLISEVFGGGGSEEDAPYNHDFVELYNPGSSPVFLDGWSVQYTKKSAWEQTPLSGTIPAHGYYLVSEQSDDPSLGEDLPTPDASGDIDLDNHYGEVVLLSNQAMLKQKDPNQDANKNAVMDFIGYGDPSDVAYYEGSGPAPEATKKKSIGRKAINPKDPNGPGLDAKPGQLGEFLGNGYNSKNNSADFTTVSDGSQADPKNSESTIAPAINKPTPPNESGGPSHSGSSTANGESGGSNGANASNGSQADLGNSESTIAPAIHDSILGAMNHSGNTANGESGGGNGIILSNGLQADLEHSKSTIERAINDSTSPGDSRGSNNDTSPEASSTMANTQSAGTGTHSNTSSHFLSILLGCLLLVAVGVMILLLRRKSKKERI